MDTLEGRRVQNWMDEWGWRLGTLRAINTRRSEKEGERSRVLGVGVWVGNLEVEGGV